MELHFAVLLCQARALESSSFSSNDGNSKDRSSPEAKQGGGCLLALRISNSMRLNNFIMKKQAQVNAPRLKDSGNYNVWWSKTVEIRIFKE